MKNNWKAHQLESPMDFGFDHLRTVEETRSVMAEREQADLREYGERTGDSSCLHEFNKDWMYAQVHALEAGWQGDFNGGPYVAWVPRPVAAQYIFVIKQENDGHTFVVAPRELGGELFGE